MRMAYGRVTARQHRGVLAGLRDVLHYRRPQAVVLRCPARAASSDCYAEFEDKPLTPTRICIPHSPGAAESHQLDFSADAHYMQLLGTAYYISCAKTC
jgi:hypothetical protein